LATDSKLNTLPKRFRKVSLLNNKANAYLQKILSTDIFSNLQKAALYFGSSLLHLVFSVITSPIFARHLEPNDFAIIGYFGSLGVFFGPLFNLSFASYYIIRYFKQTEEENRKTLFNLIFFLNIIDVLMFGISYGALWAYFYLAKVSFPLYPFGLLTLGALAFEVFRIFLQINYRVRKKAWSFFFLSAGYVILNMAFSLLFVVTYQMGAAGKIAGPLVSKIAMTVICLYIVRKYIRVTIDFRELKAALKLSLPLLLAAYAYFPLQHVDKLYLERLRDSYEFGFYNIGYTMASYVGLASFALYQAFEPDIYKYVAQKNRRKLFLYFSMIILFMAGMSLMFILFSRHVVDYLTAGRYTRAYQYANINVVGLLLINIFGVFQALLTALQRTRLVLMANLAGGIAALIIYKIFIVHWGFQGANWARVIVAGFMIFVGAFFVKYRNHWILRRLRLS